VASLNVERKTCPSIILYPIKVFFKIQEETEMRLRKTTERNHPQHSQGIYDKGWRKV
jgi:hypothetical protein